MRKFLSTFLAVTLTATSVFCNGFSLAKSTVSADEMPQTMKMPIVIYDHLNDDMLFEYVLGTKLSMYDESDTSGNAGKGLVETQLGEDGTPVYKKETVIQLAKDLKEYLETQNPGNQTELYKRLRNQIVEEGDSEKLIGKTLTIQERGWNFGDLTYKTQDGYGYWYSGDELVWKKQGDWLIALKDGATATFDFGKLEAGNYTFTPYPGITKDVELKIITENGNEYTVSGSCDFVLDSAQNVKLTVKATAVEGALVNPTLYKDGTAIGKFTNITNEYNVPFTELGWKAEDGSTWKVSGYGGITCDAGENTEAYLEYAVTPGRTYKISSVFNENNSFDLKIRNNGTDEVMADNLKQGDTFDIPEGVNKVKICIASNKTDAEQNDYRFNDLNVEKKPGAKLASDSDLDAAYEVSKNKFTRVTGQKAATSQDIENCMDYAYYVLNTFWTDTNGDITKKTDAYKSIQLNYVNEKYSFNNSNVVYDIANKNIYRDETNAPEGDGFFPLDDDVLGEASDLTAPFGKTDELEGHNFHYAMKAHCEFIYSKAKNLSFKFEGDDDVYLFINGKLAMDIGGAHGRLSGNIDLNDEDTQTKLGLEEGETYTFDFFYMERHTTASNILIETNMYLEQASAKPSVKYTDKEGNELKDGDKVLVGEEVGINYSVVSGSDDMKDITFKDTDQGVTVGKDGIDFGDKGVYVKDNLIVEVLDRDGKVKKTYTISKEDLKDDVKKREFQNEIGNISLDKNETVVVKGLTKKADYEGKLTSTLDVSISGHDKGYDNNGNVTDKLIKVPTATVEVAIIPKADIKAEMQVTFKNPTTGETIDNDTAISQEKKIGLEYTITAKSGYMKNISVKDDFDGNEALSISSAGIELGNQVEVSDDGIKVTVTDKNGTVKETYTLSKADFEARNAAYDNFIKKFGDGNEALVMDIDDKITISGFNHTMTKDGLKSTPVGTITGPNPQYDEETDKINVVYDKADVDANGTLNAIPRVGVKYVVDPDKGTIATGDKTDYSIDENTSTGNQPTVTNKTGYTFTGWKMTANGAEKEYLGDPKDVLITEDTVFTAQFTTNKYKYTVKYVDKNGNLIPGYDAIQRAATDYNSLVSEDAIEIPGYHLVAGEQNSKNLTITENEDANVIEFVYEINKYDVKFNIEKDESGNKHGTINDAKDEITDVVEHGSNITTIPTAKADTGYEFVGWANEIAPDTILTEEEIKAMVITGNVGFVAKFAPKTYSYTVKYLDKDTNEEIADMKSASALFDSEVTETAVDVPFYAVDGSLTKSIIMKESGNEIVFLYEKNKHNVIFKAGDNGEITGDTNQSVKHDEKVTSVPTPTPDKGYEFVGWEKTVESGTVASENPANEKIAEKTTFTAKFAPLKYDYVVRYLDEDGNELLTEKRVNAVDFGTKITENAEEIYGYTPDKTKADIVIDVTDNENQNVITFVYSKKDYKVTFNTDGNGTITGKTEDNVKYNEKVSEVPENNSNVGYKFTGWTMKTADGKETLVENPANEKITGNTTFTAHYEKVTLNYSVKYVDENGKELSPSEVKNSTYGENVEETAKQIAGYTAKEQKKSVTMKLEGNEIVFVYTKNPEDKNNQTVINNNNNTTKKDDKNTKTTKKDNKKNNKKAQTTKKNKSGNVLGEDESKNNKKSDKNVTVNGADSKSGTTTETDGNTTNTASHVTSPKTGTVTNILLAMMAMFIVSIVGIGACIIGLKKED